MLNFLRLIFKVVYFQNWSKLIRENFEMLLIAPSNYSMHLSYFRKNLRTDVLRAISLYSKHLAHPKKISRYHKAHNIDYVKIDNYDYVKNLRSWDVITKCLIYLFSARFEDMAKPISPKHLAVDQVLYP